MVESGDDHGTWSHFTTKSLLHGSHYRVQPVWTWIHFSCAKFKKTNVSDFFYCQKCKELWPDAWWLGGHSSQIWGALTSLS
jgi:hypothetical protein